MLDRSVARFSAAVGICAISLTLSVSLNHVKSAAFAVPHAFSPSAATPDPGMLMMLVTNDQLLTAPEITAWVAAVAEEGVRLKAITDKQFTTLSEKAQACACIVLPDESHRFVDHQLVAAVRNYTAAGRAPF